MEVLAESILNFWFGDLNQDGTASEEKSKRWFMKDETFDKSIERIYGSYLDTAGMGGLDIWASDPKSLTALIVMLDQFPRNLYRGLERSFIFDKKALSLTKYSIENESYKKVPTMYSYFQLMPLMHSENLADQDLLIELFAKMVEESEGGVKTMMESAHFMQ